MLIFNGGQGTATITTDTNNTINAASGTAGIVVPVGTTVQRPANAVAGTLRYNTTIGDMEVYANGVWAAVNNTPPPINLVAPVISGTPALNVTLSCTTGTWSNSPTSYSYQWLANAAVISGANANTFTCTVSEVGANLTCNVTAFNIAGNTTATSNSLGPVLATYSLSYLAVAGGGGANWGGGGGGGLLSNSSVTVSPGNVFTVVVGAGGTATWNNGNGPWNNGSNTTITANVSGFSNITCIGGGSSQNVGGSGGGGGYQAAGANGTAGQGYAGGNGSNTIPWYAGGGGGAGQRGGDGNGSIAGYGGNGAPTTIRGTTEYFGGGGGGGNNVNSASSQAPGGLGGGGAGTSGQNSGASGTANTGGGGGGGSTSGSGNFTYGSGGSGVVILSVPTNRFSNTYSASNVTVTTSGSNTIMTFTSSGTYTA